MQVKVYTDTNLASALEQARDDLGSDALVLGSREIRDEIGRPLTEITVGIERPVPATRQRPDGVPPGLDLRAGIGRLLRSVTERGPQAPGSRAGSVASAERAAPEPGAVEIAVASLVQSGLSRDLAARFARIAGRDLKTDRPGRLGLAAERAVAALLPFGQIPTSERVLFVVGPPGAGKTSVVAKLAARAIEASRQGVVYAMADSEKIGAVHEARIYSKHVGCDLSVIDTPEGLARTLRRAPRHARVLVDTAGIGAADDRRMKALCDLRREASQKAQVVLVLPAGLHREEIHRVFEQFAEVRPTCVAFSKVDDGRRIGDLVTALARTDLPLSFMTNGHQVPDDLIAATPGRLAALMLRAGRPIDESRAHSASPTQESTP